MSVWVCLTLKINTEYKKKTEICFNLTIKCSHYIQNKASSEIISILRYSPKNRSQASVFCYYKSQAIYFFLYLRSIEIASICLKPPE